MSGSEGAPDGGSELPPIKELTKPQRRVLGVLLEKAYTVPESYPMTLKAVTAGCNQKNNRDPITNFSEDLVLQTLDELRELGIVAEVHMESGRTERYRHYVRKRFPFSEPQLAIMTELLLRGHQQLGELRARASRMVPVESLTDLRTELEGLLSQGYARTSGPLDRRGAEVDHRFYPSSENVPTLAQRPESPGISAEPAARPVSTNISDDWSRELADLRQANLELRAEVQELRDAVTEVRDNLASLRQSLGA